MIEKEPPENSKADGKEDVAEADLLRLARERFAVGLTADDLNRQLDQEQRRFYRGRREDQWDAGDLQKRNGRITVAINRCPQFVKQITGEMRQNKPAIRVLPDDDQTDPQLAEIYSAIIRHIESQSDAHRVYSKAGEQAVIGGLAWFRVLSDYADGKSFDQELYVKGIRNPLSVVVDPGAVEPTRCDMRWAFVSELVTKEQFAEMYPNAAESNWDGMDYGQHWHGDNKIRIAEYWTREPEARDLVLLTNGQTMWDDEITDQMAADLGAQGIGVQAKRKSERYKVKCRKITANAVLEEYEWEGSYIPLIPVIGEEIEVGDEVFRHGLIYPAMDSQKAYNYARSAMLETVAAQPKAPYLVTTKMVAQHQAAWAALNTGNPMVLPYDPDPLAPQGPQRIAPPNFASAWYQEAMVADGDMKATTGIYDASLGKQSNETSGRAIMARDQQGETASFVYVDNLSAAIRHCGRILIEMIPHKYTGERVIRMMGEDGAIEGFAKINAMMPDGTITNDLSRGQFDLEVTTGPAFATKRMEAADKMMQLVQSVPAIGQIGADMIVKALDMPYGDKLADRLALALVPPGMDPDVDKKRMENQAQQQQLSGPPQPDPAQELAMAAEQAKVADTAASTELKKAQAQKTQVETMIDVQQAHLDALQAGFNMAGTGDGL
jgi:hypothetical protein